MMTRLNYKLYLLTIIMLLGKVTCVCEESYIVICDNISDIKLNDTSTWKHVQIGSSVEQKPENLNHTLSNFDLTLFRVTHLTIISRIKLLKAPISQILLQELGYLNFYGNNIIEIQDNTFSNSATLKEVYLKNNRIQHLGRAVFNNTNLDIVDLSRNHIESITTCFYKSNIKWIRLNNNKISFIQSDAFPKNLEQLELNYNNLRFFEADTFRYLINLKELLVNYNHLTAIPDISLLKKLKYLHLRNNHIINVDYSLDVHTPKLEFLDLSSNQITYVNIDRFSSNSTPCLVSLAFNRLNNIKFNNPKRKTDLVLYGNPWICDCWFNIENILTANKHYKSCEFGFFDKGDIPFCIDDGKCSDQRISNSQMDSFYNLVKIYEEDIKKECSFRL